MASQRLNIGALARLKTFISCLRGDRRGNVAMMFGLSLPVLVMMVMGGVDISRVATVRANLQDALDAATLAAARSPYTSAQQAQLNAVGLAALKANLRTNPAIVFNEADVHFTVDANQMVTGSAKVQVKTLVANIVLPPYGKLLDDKLPVTTDAQVERSSKNIEVALVLDITGSMNNGKIEALQNAANQLVDIVVQDVQTPFYTKMSLVPYSMGVNLGSYANGARGTPTGSKANVSAIAWSTGAERTVTAATRASKAQITTSTAHGLVAGDTIAIWGATGMTRLNGVAFQVDTVVNATNFTLRNADSRSWTALTGSNARMAKCLRDDCRPRVTANGHGLFVTTPTVNGTVVLEGVQGMDQLNEQPYEISEVTANSFILNTVGAKAYTSGGKTTCGEYGCEWRVFTSKSGPLRALRNSTCVSERTGSAAYTDAAPSTSRVGYNYPASPSASENPCPSARLLPLTSNKADLKSSINGLKIGGSTAGHIGASWGWYTVSPNFNSLWPSSGAGTNDLRTTLKSVILMTDGEFNTPYAQGVISGDAGSGSGSTADHISVNATNGDSIAQALRLCSAMKSQGVTVYTVGFQVGKTGAAADMMKNCATGPDYAYLPESGADLTEAFKAIGRDITRLRIAR